MAYDDTGNSGMGQEDPGGDMSNEMPKEGMDDMHEDMGALHVSADMLPKGMTLKKGDIVEFKVIGDQDQDGDWPIEYNTGDKEESWEDGFRKEMSPRSKQEDAM